MPNTEIYYDALQDMFHDPEGPVAEIMEGKAYNVENAMKSLLLIPGTGRIYTNWYYRDKQGRLRKGGSRPPHQASAPGEPPASDYGMLLNSIGHTMIDTESGIGADIGSSSPVSTYLELGTRYMAPRPFERPALDIGLAE